MQISVSKQIHADLAHQHGFLGEGIGIAYLEFYTRLNGHTEFLEFLQTIPIKDK